MDPKETGITFITTGRGSNIMGANRTRIFNFWTFGALSGTRIGVDVSGENERGGGRR